MIEKDYQLYGTKILNLKTQAIGLLICIWKNKFADGEVDCLEFLPRSQSFALALRASPLNLFAIRVSPVQKSALQLVYKGKDTILN